MQTPTILRPALLACLAGTLGAAPSITVYNADFALVRETLVLDLEEGRNAVEYNGIAFHLEPESVILRDPAGAWPFTILEQSFRADPVSQGLLLNFFEGETIDFLTGVQDGEEQLVRGTIVRSGYVPHVQAWQRYGQNYRQRQQAAVYQGGGNVPLIEVGGKLRFGLPGTPLFPALPDDGILKPTLSWILDSGKAGTLEAELGYLTGGMSWKADYNLVAGDDDEVADITGWVTIDNQSGKDFREADVKLMAGDVNKIQDAPQAYLARSMAEADYGEQAAVTGKSFDEYHLYTLRNPITLRDRETKQVEFIRASGVRARKIYQYDGAAIDLRRYGKRNPDQLRRDQGFGTESNPKVWIIREIENSEANNLGIPLPAGRTRFYLRDADDGQLEFTGENEIDHTPKNETLRIYTGNAFDIVGERVRTDYRIDTGRRWLTESFEIEIRNHKEEAVEVRIVEMLYRGASWEITETSDIFEKVSSQVVTFTVEVPADGSRTVTYTVDYTW